MSDQATKQNQARFDAVAAEWDSNPGRIAQARAVVEAIRKSVPLQPTMKALDFGAGTGLITLGLLPDVADITAVDASREMLRVLDQKLKALRIENVHTCLNESEPARLPMAGFDFLVSSMVLHHIPNVPQTLRQLRPCLRPGGWIALADLVTEDGTFHADATGVYHLGLDPADVCGWLREVGFGNITAREAHRIERSSADGKTREYPVFLVIGQAT